MNPGSVNRMDYWCIVGLLVDGISRREDAVVNRASFSYQAESFALGLRDKSDNLTHIRLQLLCRVPAGPGWQMGRRVWVNRRGKRKTSFQILESQDRGLTISVRLNVHARANWGEDRVQTRSAFGPKRPHLSRTGLAVSRRCLPTPRRLVSAAAQKSPGKRVL